MIHFLFCLIFLISSITFAEESLSTSDPTPTEKRSIVVMPMLNVVVPGLTQFIDVEPKKTSVFLSAALWFYSLDGGRFSKVQKFHKLSRRSL